jgi:hypothetical protein
LFFSFIPKKPAGLYNDGENMAMTGGRNQSGNEYIKTKLKRTAQRAERGRHK